MAELILYFSEGCQAELALWVDEEGIRFTQMEIAELFATTPKNITPHIKAILEEDEPQEQATCKDCLQVRYETDRGEGG